MSESSDQQKDAKLTLANRTPSTHHQTNESQDSPQYIDSNSQVSRLQKPIDSAGISVSPHTQESIQKQTPNGHPILGIQSSGVLDSSFASAAVLHNILTIVVEEKVEKKLTVMNENISQLSAQIQLQSNQIQDLNQTIKDLVAQLNRGSSGVPEERKANAENELQEEVTLNITQQSQPPLKNINIPFQVDESSISKASPDVSRISNEQSKGNMTLNSNTFDEQKNVSTNQRYPDQSQIPDILQKSMDVSQNQQLSSTQGSIKPQDFSNNASTIQRQLNQSQVPDSLKIPVDDSQDTTVSQDQSMSSKRDDDDSQQPSDNPQRLTIQPKEGGINKPLTGPTSVPAKPDTININKPPKNNPPQPQVTPPTAKDTIAKDKTLGQAAQPQVVRSEFDDEEVKIPQFLQLEETKEGQHHVFQLAIQAIANENLAKKEHQHLLKVIAELKDSQCEISTHNDIKNGDFVGCLEDRKNKVKLSVIREGQLPSAKAIKRVFIEAFIIKLRIRKGDNYKDIFEQYLPRKHDSSELDFESIFTQLMLSFDVSNVVKRLTFVIVVEDKDSALNFSDVQLDITIRLSRMFFNLGMRMEGVSNVIIFKEGGDNSSGMQAMKYFLNQSTALQAQGVACEIRENE
ncbi:hypothetical protein FGO68_gene2811 [Halteria grandinella]|uniref:Uncharacterized protein n=1 Tax=Halteria grandinella TaxID=5974 RepID=A0A8J8NUS2_HALGN|nr:hypothetical protein FGO68_gene2811 [Halteria grandinella]